MCQLVKTVSCSLIDKLCQALYTTWICLELACHIYATIDVCLAKFKIHFGVRYVIR